MGFTTFVNSSRPRLTAALTVAVGPSLAEDALADAYEVTWSRWAHVGSGPNPVGYTYKVALRKAWQTSRRKHAYFAVPQDSHEYAFEPGLARALGALSCRQRTVIMLVTGLEWRVTEVAELLQISESSVRMHHRRAMSRLRRSLNEGK